MIIMRKDGGCHSGRLVTSTHPSGCTACSSSASDRRTALGLERFRGLDDAQEEAPDAAPVKPASGGYSDAEAAAEAARCLGCGAPVERNQTCWYCLPCEVVCRTHALYVRVPYLVR